MAPREEDPGDTATAASPSLPALQGIAIAFAALAVILAFARLVRRWRVYRRFQLDDLFSAAAAFLVIPYTAATLVDDKVQYEMEEYALGLSASPPSLERIQNAFKTEVAATVFMWLIIYAAKAAFLTIYWRASCGRRAARHAWFAAAGVTSLCFGIIFFSVFWVCGSPTRVGDLDACQSMGEAAATRLLTLWCTLNLVDFTLLIIFPLTIMLSPRTQPDKRQKTVISAMLLLALFFMALDILRTCWALTPLLDDTTHLLLVWRVVEPIVAAILAAISGLADWCRGPRPTSDTIPDEDRGWIEIGGVVKSSEA